MSKSNLEKKFTCSKCNYITQVAGKEYYAIECNASVATLRCNTCERLFDEIVSEQVTQEEIDEQYSHYTPPKKGEKNYIENPMFQYFAFQDTIKGIKRRKRITCNWCGSIKNEIWSKENPICPKCNALMHISVKEESRIEDASMYDNFKLIINSNSKVILSYIEPSCSTCRHAEIIISEIENEYPNEFKFIKFDDEFNDAYQLTRKFNIKYLPCFLLFKDGKFVGKFSFYNSKLDLIVKFQKRFNKVKNKE